MTEAQIPQPDLHMQAVLDRLAALGARPLQGLTLAEARAQAQPADALAALMAARGMALPEILTQDITLPGPTDQGDIPARVYTPPGVGPFPVLVYFHGGGWVLGGIDSCDAAARALALGSGAVVLSAHCRQAPEHVFPAAHVDAYAAWFWALHHMADLNGMPGQIALGGEGAGANLAANVALMARDALIPTPLHLLLVHPVANSDRTTLSCLEQQSTAPLGRAGLDWFDAQVFSPLEDRDDPRINLVDRIDLQNLAPTTLILAEIDPLRSEGLALAEALTQAGTAVAVQVCPGVTQDFFGMGALVPQAALAMDFATTRLRQALHQPRP